MFPGSPDSRVAEGLMVNPPFKTWPQGAGSSSKSPRGPRQVTEC